MVIFQLKGAGLFAQLLFPCEGLLIPELVSWISRIEVGIDLNVLSTHSVCWSLGDLLSLRKKHMEHLLLWAAGSMKPLGQVYICPWPWICRAPPVKLSLTLLAFPPRSYLYDLRQEVWELVALLERAKQDQLLDGRPGGYWCFYMKEW